MRHTSLVLMAALLGVLPAAAHAGTVELTRGRMIYRALPGERNVPAFRYFHQGLEISDSAGVTAGANCVSTGPTSAQCVAVTPLVNGAELHLGDGDDIVQLDAASGGAVIFGGPGDDHLEAGPEGYNRFVGGPGRDVMIGNSAANVFDQGARNDGADTITTIASGLGVPTAWVDYGKRARPVQASLDGRRNDGEAGERDLIGSGITALRGGRADDRLTGDAADNELIGGPGTDVLAGRGGNDALIATTTGPRRLVPGTGVHGGGEDRLFGGGGRDLLEGSMGRNLLDGGSANDEIWTIGGSDRVRAADGVVDLIFCAVEGERIREDAIDLDRRCSSPTVRNKPPIPYAVSADTGDSQDPDDYFASVSVGCQGVSRALCRGTTQLRLDGHVIGEGPVDAWPDSLGAYSMQTAITRSTYDLIVELSPRISVTILSRWHGRTRRLSISLPRIGFGRSPGLPQVPLLG